MRIRDCARNCNPGKGEARIPAAVKLSIGLGDKSGRKRKIQSIMKKAFLLLLCGALALCACQKDPSEEAAINESDMTGETVDLSFLSVDDPRKIFVLNEGQMGSNNASLDVIRFSDAQYLTDVFRKVNPKSGGLGDVGNDIVVIGDEVWIAVNNSGIVEVISAEDEKEIAAIKVPTPRRIAYDDKYVYVTSWAGAFIRYAEDYTTITASANPKGQVYRIDRQTKKVKGSVEVGYQPEGVGLMDGNLYVANSGGVSYNIAPDYAYDHTISVIDAGTFGLTKTIDTGEIINLKDIYFDSYGDVYFTSQGDYGDRHSGLYAIDPEGKIIRLSYYVSVLAQYSEDFYWFGTKDEFDWEHPKTWGAWYWGKGAQAPIDFPFDGLTPYGVCMPDQNTFLVADAGDYYNPGTLTMVHFGQKKWTVTAGVCPGHFAIWW